VTEYEMIDVIMNRFAHMTDQASLYFALVSGYLITAYLVGARLTRFQVSVISLLFLLWTVGILGGYMNAVKDTLILEAAIREEGQVVRLSDSTYAYSFAVVQALGILASFAFMWSVRHPKEKRTL